MGSSASKASRAANSAARVYPTRASQAATNAPKPSPAGRASQPGPTVRPQPQASETKDETIDLDAADPAYAAQLRSLGAVDPNPYASNSSTSPYEPQRRPISPTTSSTSQRQPGGPRGDAALPDFSTGPNPYAPLARGPPQRIHNPALTILSARERLAAEAEQESANVGRKGAARRAFLDVVELRKVLVLRDQRGKRPGEIEAQLGLREGVVGRLGPRGVVEVI